MQRWKIIIEYDGGPYVGWQKQDNGVSIQGILEKAIFDFSGENVKIQASGRTDAGVHALAQVAHFDLEKTITGLKIREALNYHTKKHPIAIIEANAVNDEFNARFDAKMRYYRYRICDRRAKPALDIGRIWHIPRKLNVAAMHDAAQILIGNHDFTSFRAIQCQAKSPIRSLDSLNVARIGNEIHITAKAKSFLHHQIRNFAGTLHLVGVGKWDKARVKLALDAKDRRQAGPTAPPHGLYLIKIEY